MQSQAETVATTGLARKAVAKLDLAQRDEFNPKSSANPLGLVLSLFAGRAGGRIGWSTLSSRA